MIFSFVLPAYKGKYLAEAINSILHQSYQNFELVIVDDCSPDSIREIVSSFNDDRISYYRNEKNIGGKDLVAQWNHCLTLAKGDYVILATDDDLYESDFLKEISALANKYPDVNLLQSRIMQIEDSGKILGMDGYYKERMTFEEFVFCKMHGMKSGIPQYVFKKKALVEAGGFVSFPHAWASDEASAILMAKNGVAISNKCLVKFRLCSGINITSNNRLMPDKTRAMLLYYGWLKDHLSQIRGSDEYSWYLYRNTVGNLSVFAKQMIIHQVGPTSFLMKLKCLSIIVKGKDFSLRDKLSIIRRTL